MQDMPCNCLALRRAARRVTQLYDRALAPSGLRATQFPILELIHFSPDITMKDLARDLVMDRATLGHNLRPLEAQGLLVIGIGADRRQRPLTLTQSGKARLRQARALWEAAQRKFEAAFGHQQAVHLRGILAQVDSLRFEDEA
jgi:DNA-binding MarR family transcriptional regulator